MRPMNVNEYQRFEGEFELSARGLAHFSLWMQYVDNSALPNINAKWEEVGFFGLLVPKTPNSTTVENLVSYSPSTGFIYSEEQRYNVPAILKIPKRFFYDSFEVLHPNAPTPVKGTTFSLADYYLTPSGGAGLAEQTLLLRRFILRSNYGQSPRDLNRKTTTYTFGSEFYESPDAVHIRLVNEDTSESYTPWPNIHFTGLDTPEVTQLVGRYGRDAALEMLGLTL